MSDGSKYCSCLGDKILMGSCNIEQTGPLSYLVQVSEGQTYIDHLQQMTDSPQEDDKPKTSTESFMGYPHTSGCTEKLQHSIPIPPT